MKNLYALLILALVAVGSQRIPAQKDAGGSFLHSDKGMRSLKSASGQDFEKRFLSQTIEHHRGSIELSQKALSLSLNPGVKKRAQTIVARAEHEIRLLTTWLSKWYKTGPQESEVRLIRGDMAERMNRPIKTQKDYIDQMVGHEEEEVQMGQFVARRSVHRQLSQMAAAMVRHSEADILYFLKALRAGGK